MQVTLTSHATTDAEFGKGAETWGGRSHHGDGDGVPDGQGFEPLKDMKSAPGQFVMALMVMREKIY
jgi:hypothetical protein